MVSSNPLKLETDQQGLGHAWVTQRSCPLRPGHPPPSPAPPPPPSTPAAPYTCSPSRVHRPLTWHQAFPRAVPTLAVRHAQTLRGWPPSTYPPPQLSRPLWRFCSLHLGTPVSNATSSKKSSPDASTPPPSRGGFSLPEGPGCPVPQSTGPQPSPFIPEVSLWPPLEARP